MATETGTGPSIKDYADKLYSEVERGAESIAWVWRDKGAESKIEAGVRVTIKQSLHLQIREMLLKEHLYIFGELETVGLTDKARETFKKRKSAIEAEYNQLTE